MRSGVLLLAYGSPDTARDVECFLLDVRGGRPTPPELVAELRSRYQQIGGRSPLLELTQAQAAAVRTELQARGLDVPLAIGMRHWDPHIKVGLAELQAAGAERVVVLILAPHRCLATMAAYEKAVLAAQAELGAAFALAWVPAWSQQPRLIAAQVDALRQALAQVPAGKRCKVLFSAHSLPTRIVDNGDPYPTDLAANAAAIAQAAGVTDWQFVYQSAGAAGGAWLGPDIQEVLPGLADAGYQWLVSQPIGFVCDHLEILFDIDIETRHAASQLGLGLSRAPSMNSHPDFIGAIADALTPLLQPLPR